MPGIEVIAVGAIVDSVAKGGENAVRPGVPGPLSPCNLASVDTYAAAK